MWSGRGHGFRGCCPGRLGRPWRAWLDHDKATGAGAPSVWGDPCGADLSERGRVDCVRAVLRRSRPGFRAPGVRQSQPASGSVPPASPQVTLRFLRTSSVRLGKAGKGPGLGVMLSSVLDKWHPGGSRTSVPELGSGRDAALAEPPSTGLPDPTETGQCGQETMTAHARLGSGNESCAELSGRG